MPSVSDMHDLCVYILRQTITNIHASFVIYMYEHTAFVSEPDTCSRRYNVIKYTVQIIYEKLLSTHINTVYKANVPCKLYKHNKTYYR